MSWNNPTAQEAEEAYDQAKSKYEQAAEAYIQNKNKIESYEQDYGNIYAKGMAVMTKKAELKKKFEKILEVQAMLNPGGAVDQAVANANKALKVAQIVLSNNLTCTNTKTPTIEQVFKCPTVEEHEDSLEARQSVRKARIRYEQELEECDSKVSSYESELESLKAKVASCTDEQKKLSKIMNDCTYEMNHYKKFLE